MGYRWTNCVVIGVNIGFETLRSEMADYDEFYEKYRTHLKAENRGEIVYLEDGISGEYFIVGELLFSGDAASETIPFFEFDFNEQKYQRERERVTAHIKEKFNVDVEPKIMVLTHLT